MDEIWKDIPGYETRYQVSNIGRVRSLDYSFIDILGHHRFHKGKILKLHLDEHGYYKVNLYLNRDIHESFVHRLVALAFIPNPNNLPFINHKDENPKNNHVENLEWCTHKYNVNYGSHNERVSRALSIPVSQFDMEGNWIRNWPSIISVNRELGTKGNMVGDCCYDNKTDALTAKGYIWRHTKPEYGPGYKLDPTPFINPSFIKVTQFEASTGLFVKNWINMLQAAKANNLYETAILANCIGKTTRAGNYIWKYTRPEYKEGYILYYTDLYERPVNKINCESNNILKIFPNLMMAFKDLNVSCINGWQRLLNTCLGKQRSAYRYRYEFVDYPIYTNPTQCEEVNI